jgi:hypothetical protein
MGLYYRIWVDCILRLKSIEANKNNWKYKSIASMSIAMTFNLILIMVILQKNVFGYFYEINFRFLSDFENYILTILILYMLPNIIINYLMIFRDNRFEKFLEKYPYRKGKLFLKYFLISMFLPILLLWGGILLTKLNIIK